jgi:hypothetical protein
LKEPDALFIKELAAMIRNGVRPQTAALYLGCASIRRWQKWKQRQGPAYVEMRAAVAAALATAQAKLQLDLARRSPGAALKELQRNADRDAEREEERRSYQPHGLHTLKKALPAILDRVRDPNVSLDDLNPIEQAARTIRDDMLRDAGGLASLTTAKRILLDNLIGSVIIAHSLDRFVFELASTLGLASRKHRRAWPVVMERMRIGSVLTSQLQAFGLDKPAPKVLSLTEAIEAAKAEANDHQNDHGNGHPNGDHA